MRYTLKDMQKAFGSDDTCLQFLFDKRFGGLDACPKCGVIEPKFYRVKKRMSFVCKDCKGQLFPLVGTIFEKSTTPLTDWFHAIYLFSVSKNGVSAKELERQIGVSYKTAHRMEKMIRRLMREDDMFGGGVGKRYQADEAFIGGKNKQEKVRDNKTPIMAVLEVGGDVRTAVVPKADSESAIPFLSAYVPEGSTLHTDESMIYKHHVIQKRYMHASIKHASMQFVKNGVTTNHIEGFFGQLKRSLDGTYHSVSPQYLSWYVSEFAFRYNHRNEVMFPLLLARAAQQA